MRVDPIYTPTALASEMAACIQRRNVASLGDFAVGGGELLRAAERIWPDAELFGADLDAQTIVQLRTRHRHWRLFTGDFLLEEQLRDRILAKNAGRFEAMLLNPPFSCRGAGKTEAFYLGITHYVSPALAFVMHGLSLLSASGEASVLVPLGSLYSERDAGGWKAVRALWDVSVVRECDRSTFESCYPTTALLHIKSRNCANVAPTRTEKRPQPLFTVKVLRGKVQMHKAALERSATAKACVLHTTNLRAGRVVGSMAYACTGNATIEGFCVLLPRVGKPEQNKLVMHNVRQKVRLSDCVFALKGPTDGHTRDLFTKLCEHWESLAAEYVGTGARFLTIGRVKKVLCNLGYAVETVSDLRTQVGDFK